MTSDGIQALKSIREYLESLYTQSNGDVGNIYPFIVDVEELCHVIQNMEDMIGSDELKTHVAEMLQLLLVSEGKTDGHTLHTVITGVPGTGKTTWALLLAQAWAAIGALTPKPPIPGLGISSKSRLTNQLNTADRIHNKESSNNQTTTDTKNKKKSNVQQKQVRFNDDYQGKDDKKNREEKIVDRHESKSKRTSGVEMDTNNVSKSKLDFCGAQVTKITDSTTEDVVVNNANGDFSNPNTQVPPESSSVTNMNVNVNDTQGQDDLPTTDNIHIPFFDTDPVISILNTMQHNLSHAATFLDDAKNDFITCNELLFEDKQINGILGNGLAKHDTARDYISQTMRANYQVRKDLSFRALVEFSQMLSMYSAITESNSDNEQNSISSDSPTRNNEYDDENYDEFNNITFAENMNPSPKNPSPIKNKDSTTKTTGGSNTNTSTTNDDPNPCCDNDIIIEDGISHVNTTNISFTSLLSLLDKISTRDKNSMDDEIYSDDDDDYEANKDKDINSKGPKNTPKSAASNKNDNTNNKVTPSPNRTHPMVLRNTKKNGISSTNDNDTNTKQVKSKVVFRIVSRVDLVAGYTGQTAKKTTAVLDSMRGGVLVIDEAYALKQDDKDWFGQEAIDTINLYMSQHADSIVIIFVGYKDPTEAMLKTNPGIARRIGWRFNISNYEPSDLTKIFLKQCIDSGWTCDASIKEIDQILTENKKYFESQGGDTFRLLFQCKLVYAKYNWKSHQNSVVHFSTPNDKVQVQNEDTIANNTTKADVEYIPFEYVDDKYHDVTVFKQITSIPLDKEDSVCDVDNDDDDDGKKLNKEILCPTPTRVITTAILKEAMQKHTLLVDKENGHGENDNDGEEMWRRMFS